MLSHKLPIQSILSNDPLKILTFALVLIFLLVACSPATPQPPTPIPGSIYIDPTQSLGPISPFVYGANTGPWAAVPYERIDDALALKLTFFRYPGGAWGDQNDLQKYQIDQYIDSSHQMGAEPSICVRVPGSTPEKAAELVRYTNIEKKYGVKYWCIGNEPTLYQSTKPNLDKDYNTATYNQVWREIAVAMRATDPTILFIGPEVHQYTANPASNPKDTLGRDWMDEFLKVNGDMVDIVSIHRYPFPVDRYVTTRIDDMRTNPQEWDSIILYLRSRIKELTGRDLPIAVTEINSHWSQSVGTEASPDSFYNAIWWADVLGHLIRQDVEIVTYFMLPAGPGGFGLFARTNDIRPTYYTFMMYQHFGTELVSAESGTADVSAYAALRSDENLTVMVINLSTTSQSVPLQLTGEWQLAESWLFDSSHNAEQVELTTFANGNPVDLPAQSIYLFIFTPSK